MDLSSQQYLNLRRECSPFTFQSVDSPLFKLLERDLSGGRHIVEVQTVWIFLLLEGRSCELLLFVIEDGPSLGVNSMVVLSYHDAGSSNQPSGFFEMEIEYIDRCFGIVIRCSISTRELNE